MSGKFTAKKTLPLDCLFDFCRLLFFAWLFGSAASAQTPPPTLIQAPVAYGGAINTIPNAVAMGDFNADGYLDFAVVEYNPSVSADGEVKIFLGNQDGSFTAGNAYPIGTVSGQPYATNHVIGVGHFNGPDQPLGIAVAVNQAPGCTSGGVVLLYGNGDGTFQIPTCLANATGVTSLAISDYNNDGFDDIAVGNASGAAAGTLTVYLNMTKINSSTNQSGFYLYGNFSVGIPSVTGAVTTLYGTIVTAKNSLRYQDGPSIALLATTGTFSQYVSVFENQMVEVNGGPLFLDFFQSTPLSISGDVFSDIAWVGPDLNPSSLVGISAAGGLKSIGTSFVTGVGGAVLGPVTTLQSSYLGLAMTVGDFDGNGVSDIAYLDQNQNLNIILNPGSATSSKIGPFGPAGRGVAAGLSTSLNKWVLVDSGVFLQLNTLCVQNPAICSPYTSAPVQFTEARSVAVFLVDPASGQPEIAPLYTQSSFYTQGSQRAFAVADYDLDGSPDVAVLGQDAGTFDATVAIYHNAFKTATPPGFTTPPTIVDLGTLLGASSGSISPTGGSPGYALAAGNFRTFFPDISIVTNEGVTVLENGGTFPFTFTLDQNCQGYNIPSFSPNPASAPSNCNLSSDPDFPGISSANPARPPILAADMNGDGYQDIVVAFPENCSAKTQSSAIYVLLSNGDGTFQKPIYIASPVVNPVGLAAGKLLGNGVPDLVVINGGEVCNGTAAGAEPPGSVGAAVIPNTGGGTFGKPVIIFSPDSYLQTPGVSSVAVADMNADGALDVVLSASDGIHVLLNTLPPVGGFTDQGAVPLYYSGDFITNAAQIDIADLNQDGFLDVVAAIDGIVYVFPGNGTGGLSTPVQAFSSGPNSNQVRTIDVNGDNVPDVLVNNAPGFAVLSNGSSPGSGMPVAQFSSLSLNFGGAALDDSLIQVLTLMNDGGAPLTLSAYTFASNTASEFSGTTVQCGSTLNPPLTITIAPGSSCTFTFQFYATAIGPASAQLIFYDNAANSDAPTLPSGTGIAPYQQTINFTAGGNPPPPPPSPLIASLSPAIGTQGQQGLQVIISGSNFVPGSTAVSVGADVNSGITVTLGMVTSTTITADLNIPQATAPGQYDVVVTVTGASSPATIPGGFVVALTIPAVKEQIAITDQVTVTPLLSNFAPGALAFSNSSLGFGGTPGSLQTLTLSNVGGATINFATGTPTFSSGFSPTQIVCSNSLNSFPISLPSGGRCAITLTSDGSAPTGMIVFTDNAALSNPSSIQTGANTYTQTILLSASGSNSAILSPPSATITIPTINETITVTDAPTILVSVPNVVGSPQAAASSTITSAGLQVAVTITSNPTVASGNVISENPPAGTFVAPGTAITLTVSSGPFSPGVGPVPTNPIQISAGTGTYNVTITLMNTGNVPLSELTLVNAALGGKPALSFPTGTSFSNLSPGATITFNATFSNTAGAAGKGVPLSLSGTYTAGATNGNWGVSFRSAVLP